MAGDINPPEEGQDKVVKIPEWENNAVGKETAQEALRSKRSVRARAGARLDAALPPHRTYFGMERRTFLWALFAIVLALLALVIGLAVGLTRGKRPQNLPLPSNSQLFTGDLTYYEPALGACGHTNTASEDIVSVSHILFDAAGSTSSNGGNSNQNPLCGLMLRAERFNEDVGTVRSVDLRVVDRCTGCAVDDIDTSLSAFEKLAPSADGRVDVTWAWLGAMPTAS